MPEGSMDSREVVNFRRFLSYIYAYEDDTKLRNVGFAKVEVRAQKIRIQISINGIFQKGGRPLKLYLLAENRENIPIDIVYLQNGHGEYRGISHPDNLWGTGLSFSRIYGICLQGAGNRRHYYMTLWRERPEQEEQPLSGKTPQSMHAAEIVSEETDSPSPAAPDSSRAMESPSPAASDNNRIVEVPSSEKPDNDQTVKTCCSKKPDNDQKVETCCSEKPDNDQTVETCCSERPDNDQTVETCCSEKPDDNLVEIPSSAESAPGENRETLTREEIQEEIRSISSLLQEEQPGSPTVHTLSAEKRNSDSRLWRRFCSCYPHVDIRPQPFSSQEREGGLTDCGKICEAVRIRPNDIGRLPRNNWILAHNSFLLNAYNHYHQLILFRTEVPAGGICDESKGQKAKKNRWFIGIPGKNSAEETLVAEVFGFKKYLNCRNGGFWYTEILLN